MERTTPPSTRRAAPVVADAWVLQTYAIIAATSRGWVNRCRTDEGRAVLKKSRSTSAGLLPLDAASWATKPLTPSDAVGPGNTLFTVTFVPASDSASPRATAICAVFVAP